MILYPTDKGEPIKMFDKTKAKPEWISTVIEHKEVSLRAKLKRGHYIVIPSTKSAGQIGKYFLNIYYDAETYNVQIKHLTKPGCTKYEIKEEDEDVKITDIKLGLIKKTIQDHL